MVQKIVHYYIIFLVQMTKDTQRTTANIYGDQESRHVSVHIRLRLTTRSARGLSIPSSGYRAAVTVTWRW